MALAAVAALPQLLAWRPWWPRPLCCKCWRGGRGGRGCGAATAGVVAAVVVAAVLQMHIWYAHPLPYYDKYDFPCNAQLSQLLVLCMFNEAVE